MSGGHTLTQALAKHVAHRKLGIPVNKVKSDEPAALRKVLVGVATGLENLLERELKSLGIEGTFQKVAGGVQVEGTDDLLWRICLKSRIAESVKLCLCDPFHAKDEKHLVNNLHAIPWGHYFPFFATMQDPPIKVESSRSRLFHTKMIERAVVDAIRAELRTHVEEKGDPIRSMHARRGVQRAAKVEVQLHHNECQIYLDGSGDLGRRLWRETVGTLPLRENLAAAIVLKTPFLKLLCEDRGVALWDPFCGAGTILLEALGIAMGHPAGSPRIRYPFYDFPCHSARRFSEVLSDLALTPHPNLANLTLLGTDMREQEVNGARKNLTTFCERMPRQASPDYEPPLAAQPRLSGDDGTAAASSPSSSESQLPAKIKFVHTEPWKVGSYVDNCMIVTKVPYGRQLGSEALRRIYQKFARLLLSRHDWRGVYCLASRRDFKIVTGLDWRTELRFKNKDTVVELLSWSGGKKSWDSYYTDD
ncbi:unnamed protein product [Vitrella brassicaformis CCMP3155]|uniref:Uncharacterized protein n=3 Tax=Vitrella brassicaformis TaxID=1169539 RepID=A0A0G4EN70_VITBC|nr:unnamed protein product [Vitrella brassicaformis CCMP3155]|eukprot:CEL98566.1 unnamed protein product [Vitrella brassicaformis CCMP3155]